MKLEDYKGRKVTELDFLKKLLIWRYSQKGLQISPKSDTDNFLKNGSVHFFGFWSEVSTKYDLQFEWNLFFRKNLQFGDICPRKKNVEIKVFGHFLDFASLVFFDFAHNNRWEWCVVVFLQFASPFNLFLFFNKPCATLLHFSRFPYFPTKS